MTRARVWTYEAVNLLEALVKTRAPWTEIAKATGNTAASCRHKASALGFVCDPHRVPRTWNTRPPQNVIASIGPEDEHMMRDERHVERCNALGGFGDRQSQLKAARAALNPWRGGVA